MPAIGTRTKTATFDIDVDADLTEAVDLGIGTLVGIQFPSNTDGTVFYLHASTSLLGTYVPVYDADGNQFTITSAASRYTVIEPALVEGVRYVKIESSTDQSTSDTVLTLMVRDY